MPHRLPLSVILATTEPWPDLENCLAVLEPQIAALGGEIVVGDGHGEALAAARLASGLIRVVRMPGASVFDLRARAAEIARGDIVATTEDHCLVGADWCAQIMRAFTEHPDALAVTGPFLNGSTEHLIDWANFLRTFGSYLPPWNQEQRVRCPPAANIAYRRSALPTGHMTSGFMELELNPRLFAQGQFFVADRITVTHVQSHGFWGTLLAHFDNGRATTGLSRIRLSARQLPWNLFRGTVRALGGDDRMRPTIKRSLPLMFVLSCCHCLGEISGVLAGPGSSPAWLR